MLTNYSTSIIKRFMSADEFETFNKRYSEAKKQTAAKHLELTERDIEIARRFRAGSNVGQLGKEYKMTDYQVVNRVAKAVQQGII